MNRRLNLVLKISGVAIAGAAAAAQALGDGPMTSKDVMTIVAGVVMAVVSWLHTSPFAGEKAEK